jgi:signal transduction histidine kinase
MMRPATVAHAMTRPVRNLRMIWKLLIPSLVLILVVGTTGAYWTVRFLTSRAQVNLEGELVRRSVDADVFLRDQSLYLLESIRFAANIEGVAEAVSGGNSAEASRLLASVLAVRPKLDLLVATDGAGTGLVEAQPDPAAEPVITNGAHWTGATFIDDVLAGRSEGEKRSGFITVSGHRLLAMAGPVRAATGPSAGVIVVAMDVNAIVRDAERRVGAPIALYDGATVVGASVGPNRAPPPAVQGSAVRRRERLAGKRVETAYTDVDLQGGLRGIVAVSLSSDPAFAPVRGAGSRLVVVLVAAMLAGGVLAALLSRLVLAQVKLLVDTNRRLGRGDLSARVNVLGTDELGELATGLNVMAEQLEASYNELEMRVAARTEELRRVHESRSEFFAAIGHEFRTPLFAIKGHADLMLDPDFRPKGDAWVGEFGTVIQEAAADLLSRVDEILELARSSSGRLELELAPMSLTGVVHDVESQITALARRADLTLAIDVPSGRGDMVTADGVRLRQIIMNLVSNAVKYTPPGGEVGVAVTTTATEVVLAVRDTGVGIPGEVGDRIFEPFYQVKGTHAQHGESSSGLGLALTKRLVEVHGGAIEFTSRPGLGTTFMVRLPRRAVPTPPRKRARRSSVPAVGMVLAALAIVPALPHVSDAPGCITAGAAGVAHTVCA